jgi:hypothetical protein
LRFQINGGGYLIGQVLVPNSTIIDLTKPDAELTEFERLAKGHPIPIDSTALDADAAISILRSCPDHHRHRLRRQLSPVEQQTFEKLLALPETTLRRLWPQGAG